MRCLRSAELIVVLSAVAGIAATLPSLYAAEPSQAEARQLLDASGIQGGLVVQLGCGDGKQIAALAAAGPFLVQALDTDEQAVAAARRYLQTAGLYGKVTVDRWTGKRLPYIDNLVNLLVADEAGAPAADEMLRVLAPQGVAMLKQAGRWTKTVKPRPAEIDEWTHYLYDAGGNAVSHDKVVGPPRHLQWVAPPKWSRHHDHMASMSAVVSSGGRIFYIVDEGPTASIRLPAQWFLVARDAFNGTLLWKRAMDSWNTHLWPLKSGPAQMPRRLVAVGNEVYVTLALDAPLVALDAATGRTLRTYETTKNTEELILSKGVLFLLVNASASKWPEYRQTNTYVWDSSQRANRDWGWDEQPRRIVAIEAATARVLWQYESCVAPLTLTADAANVLLHDGEKIVCLDRDKGRVRWQSAPVSRRKPMPVSFGPTLVVHKDVVLFSGGDRSMAGLALADGKILWTAPHPRSGHASPEDLLIVQDLAWAGEIANGADSGVFKGRDLHTGEVKREFAPDLETYWFHHRCYRAKATDTYLLTSRTGIEFIDLAKQHWTAQHWVRGGCIYGIMPANGMVYAPPHSCGCYLESKLTGLNALAPASASRALAPQGNDGDRLQRGPAYEAAGIAAASDAAKTASPAAAEGDWPTYRHDAARSGSTKTVVPTSLKRVWQTSLGGKLTSPVIAAGKVFVAAVDAHTVHALDAASGKSLWSYTAGARVDSPPTVQGNRVVFGSADGWVYCLRAADGALAWRFRAAPDDRRMVACEQLESPWPTSGSVLVQDGSVYCVAGRSMFLDGGLRLLRLDLASGRKLGESVLDDRDPKSDQNLQVYVKGLTMPVALPDILSSDGKRIYMRSQQFDLEGKRLEVAPRDLLDQQGEDAHLLCQVGLLDDTSFHRSYWEFGKSVGGGYGSWFNTGRYAPSGKILVFDDATVYGYGRKPEYYTNTSVIECELFAANKQPNNEVIARVRAGERKIISQSAKKSADSSDWKLRQVFPRSNLSATQFKWLLDQPSIEARALVLAGSTLFVAGPPDVLDERQSLRLPDDPEVQATVRKQAAALRGELGGLIWVVSAAEGKPLARYRLDGLPVFDGMVAAMGRLVLATTDGRVVCLGADGKEPLPAADKEPLKTVFAEPADKPAGWQLPQARKDGEFEPVRNAAVLASKLGYRIRAEEGKQASVALKKLTASYARKVVLKARLQIQESGQLKNGFITFGDGPKEGQLVRCGFRFRSKAMTITQGAQKGAKTDSKSNSKPLEFAADEILDVVVTVDLKTSKVAMTVKGQTLEVPLARPIARITHVGYSVDNATTDFSPIEVTGE